MLRNAFLNKQTLDDKILSLKGNSPGLYVKGLKIYFSA